MEALPSLGPAPPPRCLARTVGRAVLVRVGLAIVVAIVVASASCHRGRAGTVKIAAASDLARAFEELGKLYTARTGVTPLFTFGSSGLLAKQIEQGAPYAVYAAANQRFVDDLIAGGHCDGASKRLYARGRLVVWSKTEPVLRLVDLTGPAFRKIAIANPEHAPYGVAAREALRAAQLWDPLVGRMVYAENVRQALQWAQDGQADAAIVALSLATVTEGGRTMNVNPALHAPLDQAAAVCAEAGSPAALHGAQFLELLAAPEGKEIMQRYGFVVPGSPE
jgi:molybdate transport system substrate-binding protein